MTVVPICNCAHLDAETIEKVRREMPGSMIWPSCSRCSATPPASASCMP